MGRQIKERKLNSESLKILSSQDWRKCAATGRYFLLIFQGCHAGIKAKFRVFIVISIVSPYFYQPQNIKFILLPLPIERYTSSNIHSKPQSHMQQSLLQKLNSITGLSLNSKFASKPKYCSCIPLQF